MQLLFRYGFLKFQNIFLSLNDWQYGLLVLATVLIAAAGYVINDILDQETDYDNDKVNVIVGKFISEKAAYNLYFILNITGVGIGYYLASVIHKPSFAGAFIIISATLYMYATSLKQMLLIGNIVVALLLSFSVIIIGLFDLLPATYEGNQTEMGVMFSILIDYAVFAFIINLIREIVKDMEDVEGDFNEGLEEGAMEGVSEGLFVGELEGVVEGDVEEGLEEGVMEGATEGLFVGESEGVVEGDLDEGLEEGVMEGATEGLFVGNFVGVVEGDFEEGL